MTAFELVVTVFAQVPDVATDFVGRFLGLEVGNPHAQELSPAVAAHEAVGVVHLDEFPFHVDEPETRIGRLQDF